MLDNLSSFEGGRPPRSLPGTERVLVIDRNHAYEVL